MATNPPHPQFGVSLTPPQLNSELPFSVQYGVTPDNKYIPVQVDENGQLSIGNVTITGPVTVNDVVIKGVDPDNGNASEDIAVVNWGMHGFAMRSSIFYQGNPLLVNPDGSIDVNITSPGSPPTNLNTYTENLAVAPSSTTTLFSYTVPAGHTYNFNGFIGWGTYDGEFLVLVNSTNKGGGWSSPTNRTLQINYGSTPIIANAGDNVTVTITNYATSSQTFRLNVLADLI